MIEIYSSVNYDEEYSCCEEGLQTTVTTRSYRLEEKIGPCNVNIHPVSSWFPVHKCCKNPQDEDISSLREVSKRVCHFVSAWRNAVNPVAVASWMGENFCWPISVLLYHWGRHGISTHQPIFLFVFKNLIVWGTLHLPFLFEHGSSQILYNIVSRILE